MARNIPRHSSIKWTHLALVLLAAGAPARLLADHNTCQVLGQIPGGEAAAKAAALAYMNAELPMNMPASGWSPVLAPGTRARLRIQDAYSLNIECETSKVSYRLHIRVRIRKRTPVGYAYVSRTGVARVEGHYRISLQPPEICMENLKVAGLNLVNVPNYVDTWLKNQINGSDLLQGEICVGPPE